MGANVLSLLDTFYELMVNKATPENFKVGTIASLRYLVEDLCFYTESAREKSFDSQGMKI